MILVLMLLFGSVLGWLYILCRLVNRLSSLADRYVRLSTAGLLLLFSAPAAFAALAWNARLYARGWWAVDWHAATQYPALLALIAAGWCALLFELVRRRIAAYTRFPTIAARVIFHPAAIEDVWPLLRWRIPGRNALYSLFSLVPGNCLGSLHTFNYDVLFPQLPENLDGLTIVHLSDIHHVPALDPRFFARIVEKTNECVPDIIVLTGDYTHANADAPALASLLAPLRARYGVFFVCGNHDIWHDEKELVAALTGNGFSHVAGKMVAVAAGKGVLHIAGTERPWRKDRLATQLDTLPPDAFCLALSHHPDNVRWLRRHGAAFVLSGHTHGGQIALPGLGPLLVPSAYGSRHATGFVPYRDSLLYVNYGLSVTLPFRVLCPPEIARFTLRRATPALRTPPLTSLSR